MKTIQLYGHLPEADVVALEGQLIDESAYDLLVDGDEDVTVVLPSMEPLFTVRRQAVAPGTVQAMYETLMERIGKLRDGEHGSYAPLE